MPAEFFPPSGGLHRLLLHAIVLAASWCMLHLSLVFFTELYGILSANDAYDRPLLMISAFAGAFFFLAGGFRVVRWHYQTMRDKSIAFKSGVLLLLLIAVALTFPGSIYLGS